MELKTEVLDTQQQQQQPQLPPPQQQQHFHVLAVDDSIIDRKLLEKLLKVSSYQVTCVDSVDKALEYLGLDDNLDDDSTASSSSSSSSSSSAAAASSSSSSSSSQSSKQEMKELQVNMIMTDYFMPGMNGYDLLKRVKGSSWKDVPVVVMSSENVPSIINMCLEGGAEEFLLKPVQLSDLKKLQPRLLKSLGHSCKTIHNENVFNIVDNENENKNIFNIFDIENIFIVDNENENENIFNIVDNENEENNEEDNNSNGGKRKAMSPQPSERRHKLKGVALV